MIHEKTPRSSFVIPGLSLVALLLLSLIGTAQGRADDKDTGVPPASLEETLPGPSEATTPERTQVIIRAVLAAGRKDAEERIRKDPDLRALAAKYPLVVLHTRAYAGGVYLQSAYSFTHETADPDKHGNDVQLIFSDSGPNGGNDIFMSGGRANLVADLGNVDFTVNPDPKSVDINGNGQNTWLTDLKAVEGHVYLERVRDDRGNKFFVLFKVVAVEKDSKYMAFLWRTLPGGKVVKPK